MRDWHQRQAGALIPMRARASWRERTFDAALAAEIEAAGMSPLMSRLLASRGVCVGGLEGFLDPSIKRLASPDILPGVADAVAVIAPFVRTGRKIIVFGDYDADGVCASAILVSTLRSLGAHVDAFIPERIGEGYGMTKKSLDRLFQEHPDVALVVTVDNGITSAAEVAEVKARGVAVVVTDHHLPPAPESDGTPSALPAADALVNPRVAAGPGCEELCGAGVAFFLAGALVAALRDEAVEKGVMDRDVRMAGPLLVLAGLATVADLMPLKDQNRILVTAALAAFRRSAPIGLRELVDRAARRAEILAARDFAFLLAPRLNAAGRMASARLSYDLLMTTDREAARRLAFQVDAHNAERKTEEQRMDHEAREQVADEIQDALVVAESRCPAGTKPWHPGVVGIVAARLLEVVHVPVAVVAGDHGSARAPEGDNVRAALDAAAETLVRYGGHAAAGGFTVKPGRLDDFQQLFSAACAACRATAPDAGAIPFDGWLLPAEITMDLYKDIRRLEPFGEGNPEPVFGFKGVFFSDARPVGQDGRHAVFAFAGRGMPRAVWWGHGAEAETVRAHAATRYDVLFTLTCSDYGTDVPHVELRIVDIRPAA